MNDQVSQNVNSGSEGFADDDAPFDAFVLRDSVRSVLADEIVFIGPDQTIREAAEALRVAEVGLGVVGNEDKVVGVVSERDIVRAVALGYDTDTTIVDVIETDDLRWAAVDVSIGDVAEELLANHLRHLLIRDNDGSFAGVVSMREVLAAYVP